MKLNVFISARVGTVVFFTRVEVGVVVFEWNLRTVVELTQLAVLNNVEDVAGMLGLQVKQSIAGINLDTHVQIPP